MSLLRCMGGCVLAVLIASGVGAPVYSQMASEPSIYESSIDEARTAMMRDPAQALAAAERAAASLDPSAQEIQQAERLAQARWLQAEALTRLGRPADAVPVVEAGLQYLQASPNVTKLNADLLLTRGRIAMALANFETAFTSYTEAYDVFRQIGETRSEAIVLQSIGSLYTAAGQYERALEFFDDAMERYSDPSLDLAALNNRANALRELERYGEALDAYQQALAAAGQMGSLMLEARILNNIAALHVSFDNFPAAEASLSEADLRVAGAGSGEWSRFLDGVRAQLAMGRGDPDQARAYLERTFDGVALESSPQNFIEFHQAGVAIYAALGEWRVALDHLTAFKRLDDEARSVAASVNSALLGAEFEFAEQDLQIEQLRAERLEQDLALSSERARANILALCALIAVILALFIAGAMRYRAEAARKRALAVALYRDSETGLRTRQALGRRLMTGAAKGLEHYLLAFEIDRHDQLRAALGFSAFAALKVELAERLTSDRDEADVAVIAPGVLGVLIDYDLVDDEDEQALAELALALRSRLSKPVRVGELDIDAAITVGAALCGPQVDEPDVEAIIKEALAAADQARTQRKPFARFDRSLFGDPARNLAIMSRMNAALSSGEIAMHYQAKLNVRTGRFDSAEALIRWTDPERGYIPPDAYIPLAEETGHIRELTRWTLERALLDQVALAKSGQNLAIAVNISSMLLTDTDFAARAAQLASQSRGGLIFEVTETAIMADVDTSIRTLETWARAGVKISIDDYGTGQSSLAYLKRLPASELKLDRAFIKDVTHSQRDRMLVKSTVDLAHNLGLTLTAEGVEDDETLQVLKLMGCDGAQGFGLVRPCSLIDLVGFLQRHREAADDAASGYGASGTAAAQRP